MYPEPESDGPATRPKADPHGWDLLAAIACGGLLGAECRYGLGRAVPAAAGHFPWATLLVNVSGCLLIGVLMVALELGRPRRLLRPFLGVGVLGGYTTFSTFGVEAVTLVTEHHAGMALSYVLSSVALCLIAVWAATAVIGRSMARTELPGAAGGVGPAGVPGPSS
jgi:fluoride exporter